MKKEKVDLTNFKAYAAFLYKNHLDAIVTEDLRVNKEVNLPLLKLFTHLSETELIALSKKGMEEYLLGIIEGKAMDIIIQSMDDWKNDKLPGISRDKIVASDISLIYFVRKNTLFTFLPFYTKDINLGLTIIKEIEKFY